MQQEFEKIDYAFGSAEVLENMCAVPPLQPFSEEVVSFLSRLGQTLRAGTLGKDPDISALAFWCRRASLEEMKRNCGGEILFRLGRGTVLHFAPSNIPVLFAFSLAAGLLAGNSCVVKLPSKKTPQADYICNAIESLCDKEFANISPRIVLLRCGHDKDITDALSQICDVRVLWGGDLSVEEIRKSPLKPYATDIPFVTRGGLAVFSAEAVIEDDNITATAKAFFNDTYLNDQNACSSPHIIYWLGENGSIEKAKQKFWNALDEYARAHYEIADVSAVAKYAAALKIAAENEDTKIIDGDNLIKRVQVETLCSDTWNYTSRCGFFIECCGENLDKIVPTLTRYCQTVCYTGDIANEIFDIVKNYHTGGVDRIVPVGHTLDFSLVWDGFDLIKMMSRKITIVR